MHGEISIHLPMESKANIRFRTHRGVILTNFDDKALVTKTEVSNRPVHIVKIKEDKDKDKDKDDGPTTPAALAAPGKHDDTDSDWHAEVRDSIRDAAEAAADAAREAADAMHEGLMEAHVEFSGNMPPLPPMTGGKVVSGTLNGGGVEIQAATLNGDILLKKSN
jgi:hypothetical protein